MFLRVRSWALFYSWFTCFLLATRLLIISFLWSSLIYTPSRSLTQIFHHGALELLVPHLWNSLPLDSHNSDSLHTSKDDKWWLKTVHRAQTFVVAVLEPLQSDIHSDFDLFINPDVFESFRFQRGRLFRRVHARFPWHFFCLSSRIESQSHGLFCQRLKQ